MLNFKERKKKHSSEKGCQTEKIKIKPTAQFYSRVGYRNIFAYTSKSMKSIRSKFNHKYIFLLSFLFKPSSVTLLCIYLRSGPDYAVRLFRRHWVAAKANLTLIISDLFTIEQKKCIRKFFNLITFKQQPI